MDCTKSWKTSPVGYQRMIAHLVSLAISNSFNRYVTAKATTQVTTLELEPWRHSILTEKGNRGNLNKQTNKKQYPGQNVKHAWEKLCKSFAHTSGCANRARNLTETWVPLDQEQIISTGHKVPLPAQQNNRLVANYRRSQANVPLVFKSDTELWFVLIMTSTL